MATHSIDGVIFQDFTAQGPKGKEVELCSGGKTKRVTDQNKLEYLNLLVDYKLNTELDHQLQALIKGFSLVLNPAMLQILSPQELEQAVCGEPSVNVDDIAAECSLTQGYSPESPTIQMLWRVLSGFDAATRSQFMRFVTGSNRVPGGGMAELSPKFTIQKVDDVSKLPSASTCFNLLKLPAYEDQGVLDRKLKMSIGEGVPAGFSFS